MKHLKKFESLTIRKRDPRYDDEVKDIIEDCIIDLYDDGFGLNRIDYNKNTETVDLDDDTYGRVNSEELLISVYKQIKKVWTGNITIKKYFDKNGVNKTDVSTLRPSGKFLSNDEQRLSDLSEEIGNKLINLLDYEDGFLRVEWLVSGSAMPFGVERNINCNIHFQLNNMILEDEVHKNFESYENLEKIDEGWKDWLMGILISASTLFSNPASAQTMSDEEIKTEIVDVWEEFKKKAYEKQKDTTDNYRWAIFKDTVGTYLSKCPTGCDEDTLYKIEDVVARLKVDEDGNIVKAKEWRLGSSQIGGEETPNYKTVTKSKGGEPMEEEGWVSFKNIKSKTDYFGKGWDKEKIKKDKDNNVSVKHSQKRPGQKIDRWEE